MQNYGHIYYSIIIIVFYKEQQVCEKLAMTTLPGSADNEAKGSGQKCSAVEEIAGYYQ